VKVNPGQILFGSLKSGFGSRIQFLGLEGLSDEEVSGGPGQGKQIIYMLLANLANLTKPEM